MNVSIHDVASRAGVSVGTVSNVFNHPEKVTEKTVAKVHHAIDELGYIRNDAARQLRAGSSRSIGLIVHDIGNPFFAEVARGVEQRAAEDDLTVLLVSSGSDVARELLSLKLFEQQRVRGVLISPLTGDLSILSPLRRRGIATVLVDRDSESQGFSSVAVNDAGGGEQAVRHLLETGRRKIGFLGGPVRIRQVADRLEGAAKAIATAFGAELMMLPTQALTAAAAVTTVTSMLAADRTSWPDAIFAANDLLAFGALHALLRDRRIRVPDDIALIGYDDIDFARNAPVPLSSMKQPARLIGHTAADLLLHEADRSGHPPQSIRFDPELIVRQSTRPVRAASPSQHRWSSRQLSVG